jgi:hypothetical protein
MKASATDSPGYYKLKQHKLWFDDECSKLLGQRKQAKLKWLWNPRQTNEDNMNNKRHETRTFMRKRRRKYLNEKTNELKMNT